MRFDAVANRLASPIPPISVGIVLSDGLFAFTSDKVKSIDVRTVSGAW